MARELLHIGSEAPTMRYQEAREKGEPTFVVLGTGSSGNAYVFVVGNAAIVIDNGFSYKKWGEKMAAAGLDPKMVKAALITHTHSDHMYGIERLSRMLKVPLYVHPRLAEEPRWRKGTIVRALAEPSTYEGRSCRGAKTVLIPGVCTVESFSTSHDVPFSLGLTLSMKGSGVTKRFSVITDTGITTDAMVRACRDTDALFLEANYDEGLLEIGPYDDKLKARVAGDRGHLSISQTLAFMHELEALRVDDSCMAQRQDIYFIHISERNNTLECLEFRVDASYKGSSAWRMCPHGARVYPMEVQDAR